MTGSGAAGVALVIVGALARAPGLVLVGVLLVVVAWLSTLWSKHGLSRVRYTRRLAHDRAVWGDIVPLDLEISNEKVLPLAWLEARDFVTEGLGTAPQPVERSDRPGFDVLRTLWTIAPFQRVVRHYQVIAAKRGVYRFDAVRLRVADLFGQDVATEERPDSTALIVRPRTVPVRLSGSDLAPLGVRRARVGLLEDPALFAGVRPFQLGDTRRRVHWRATARTGALASKRFEPSRTREIVLALDIQTVDAPYWLMQFDDELVEALVVTTASLARQVLADGSACGLAVAGYSGRPQRVVWLPPRGGTDQLAAIADALGRLSSIPSAPFEVVLASLPHRIAPGATILTVSGRNPRPYAAALRRLSKSGFVVRHVALGAPAVTAAAGLAPIGIETLTAELSPDWRTADALVLAG